MDDVQIIGLFWERDENAIREADQKYGAYCYAIAFNILSNTEDAKECVNDVWQKTWETIPPNRPKYFRAWLGKVCRNAALNIWHRNHAQKRNHGMDVLLSELEECIPSPLSVEEQIENQAISACINKWLTSLPKEERILFVRRYWFGDSVKQLAKEHGISSEQLAQIMFRLRKDLKKVLEEEGIQL